MALFIKMNIDCQYEYVVILIFGRLFPVTSSGLGFPKKWKFLSSNSRITWDNETFTQYFIRIFNRTIYDIILQLRWYHFILFLKNLKIQIKNEWFEILVLPNSNNQALRSSKIAPLILSDQIKTVQKIVVSEILH